MISSTYVGFIILGWPQKASHPHLTVGLPPCPIDVRSLEIICTQDNRKGVSCTVCSGSIWQTHTDGHRLPLRSNGTLTLSPLCPLRIWCGVVQLEAGGARLEVSEASWRSRQAPTALTSLQPSSPIYSPISKDLLPYLGSLSSFNSSEDFLILWGLSYLANLKTSNTEWTNYVLSRLPSDLIAWQLKTSTSNKKLFGNIWKGESKKLNILWISVVV